MQVEIQYNKSFDSLLRRFKRIVQRDGILAQLCNRALVGGKPSHKKKFKRERALVRFRKKEKIKAFFERG